MLPQKTHWCSIHVLILSSTETHLIYELHMLTRWSHLWYWLMKIELSALIIDYSSQDYSNLAVRADVTRMVFTKHNAKHQVFSVQGLAWISELESCGQDVRTSVSELLRSVSVVSPLFFIFLDSQCSVTLLAFWLFIIYKSAEWNKQRCINLHTLLWTPAKMARTSKNKSKTWYKERWRGNWSSGRSHVISASAGQWTLLVSGQTPPLTFLFLPRSGLV